MDDMLSDEQVYSETRSEQLLSSLEREHGVSRRDLLKRGALALPLLAGFARLAAPGIAWADNGSPISKPLPANWFVNYGSNAEMRWDSVAGMGYTVPNERFFVRDHTGTPVIDPASWQLSVFGTGLKNSPGIGNPINFSLTDLQQMPKKTIWTAIECAGNGRSYFGTQQGTPVSGTQWGLGAIGVAGWTGVPLSTVLDQAGITSSAVDVMPSGLDSTVVASGVDAGHVRRPIPASKALDDVLLAYEMNGQPLPLDHGAPLRFVVPGWIGVANVKWVGQIEVSSQPLYSLWNTSQYIYTGGNYTGATPLTNQVVKSAFEMADNAQFSTGTQHVLTGRSWSGPGPIKRVDISSDDGATWKQAQLHGPNLKNAWARWSFPWTPTFAGSYQLRARATDTKGNTQPVTTPFNSAGYLFDAIIPHPVTVM